MRAIRRFTVRPVLPEPLAPLVELAHNLRWAWRPATQGLFRDIDPERWDADGRDPVSQIASISRDRLDALAGDEAFVARVAAEREDLQRYLTGDRWYQRRVAEGDDLPQQVAYYSAEYGIASTLPQYSGGLGILAGDHLKSASDLGVPIIGVGLLYRHGYFRQLLSRDGWQREHYPVLDPDQLPLRLLREADGSHARVTVDLPGGEAIVAQIWIAQVGRVPLLLMDSDLEENAGPLRDVTDRLYGGATDHRLRQELLLGVGGTRAVRAYCRITGAPEPEVFHMNEGHAGFLGLERVREYVASDGLDFDAALEKARPGAVFTTHTPVPAGIDRFPRELIQSQFGSDSGMAGLPVDRILDLGAEKHEGGDPEVFNMALLGLRMAGRANGVSQLHGHVSREMFAGLWPGFDESDVPISSITNGVHAPTWVAPELFELASEHGVLDELDSVAWDKVAEVPGDQLWSHKRILRQRLVDDVRARIRKSWLQRGASPAELSWIDGVLDPDVLTIGFARRVPSYKRLTLMLSDRDRLKRLLLDPERPIQLVIAGKAHPADDGGKRLIQEMVQFADDPEVRHRIVFLPNYDIGMATALYPGCDVWLNNPLRPYEACGTSGMKAALNGGLNLSILDGWWDEWFDGDNGWAIPSADGVDNPDHRDDLEAEALYSILEGEVAPRFYDTSPAGVPERWLEMVRHTLTSLGPKVLASRMVRDYVNELYAPAAVASRPMASEPDAAGDLAGWKARARDAWPHVRVEHVESSGTSDQPPVGSVLTVRTYVSLGGLNPHDVDVQVLHGHVAGDDQLRNPASTSLGHAETYADGRHRFEGVVELATTGSFGYTVRIVPRHPRLASVAELGLVAYVPDTHPADEESYG